MASFKLQPPANANSVTVSCEWESLCAQLLQQWDNITRRELESTGHNRRRIAMLIHNKCGIPLAMAESYLLNFERTLPLLG